MKIRELSVQQINAALASLEKQIELLNKKLTELEKAASKKTITVTTTTTTTSSNTTQNGGGNNGDNGGSSTTDSHTEINSGTHYSPPDGQTAPGRG